MGEKGNAVSAEELGGTAFIAGAQGTVVTVSSELGQTIHDKVVDLAADHLIDEGRERLRRDHPDDQDPLTPEGKAPR